MWVGGWRRLLCRQRKRPAAQTADQCDRLAATGELDLEFRDLSGQLGIRPVQGLQVSQGSAIGGVRPDRGQIGFGSVGALPLAFQRDAHILVRVLAVRIDGDCGAAVGFRFVVQAQGVQIESPVVDQRRRSSGFLCNRR
jgi:hypothetical protein